jgi:hypothetical protein
MNFAEGTRGSSAPNPHFLQVWSAAAADIPEVLAAKRALLNNSEYQRQGHFIQSIFHTRVSVA